jgi:hypothetical protein
MLAKLMPVIWPRASKPIKRLAASPRGKNSFTRQCGQRRAPTIRIRQICPDSGDHPAETR